MNAQAFLIVGVRNLRSSTKNTRLKVKERKLLKQVNYGITSLILRLKLALPTWSTKMRAIENLINKIWEQLRAQIFAQRSLNSPVKMKWLSATWHLFPYLALLMVMINLMIM